MLGQQRISEQYSEACIRLACACLEISFMMGISSFLLTTEEDFDEISKSTGCCDVSFFEKHRSDNFAGESVIPGNVLGIEVDYINSVQFSNHTGLRTTSHNVYRLCFCQGAGVGCCEHERFISWFEGEWPQQVYSCAHRILSGIRITDEKSALNCINYLHKKYQIPTVIITSTNVTLSPVMYGYGSRLKNPMKNNHNNSSDLLNQTNGSVTNNTSKYDRVRFKIPHFDYHFIGTGDLFAALTLAHLETKIENENGQQIPKYSFKDAFQSVLSTIQTVLSKTLKISEGESLNLSESARIELKIIQSLDDIRNPILGDYVEEM
uniref:pyridoxal kinase n=1 Tax=Schistosoma haematobium TaxID=6185 RepID=A0A094ZP76_SCHHA